MQKLLNSILRNGTLLLFLLLFAIALLLIANNQSYQRNKLLTLSHSITAPLFNVRDQITTYLNRNVHNQQLLAENQYLLKQLITKKNQHLLIDSLPFNVIPAQVIHNSIKRNHNYITLNVGQNKGIKKEMGVITARGVVGVIYATTTKTSGVISLLNKSLRVNAKLKKSNHFGSLYWDGVITNVMKLSDVPLAANVKVGDTIITGGMSAIFPGDIEIGVVESVLVPQNDNYYDLTISLFEDLTRIGNVYVVNFPQAEQVKELINSNNDE